MRKTLITAITVSVIGGILLLSALSQYLAYLGVLTNYEECEKRASELPDENSSGQALYYCNRVLGYNVAAHDLPATPLVIFGVILVAVGVTLTAMNYKPSWFGLKEEA